MSGILDQLKPRDRQAAARIFVVALLLAMVATVGWEALAWAQGKPGAGPGMTAASLAALAVSALVGVAILRSPDRVPLAVWPVVAVLQPVGTAAVTVGSDDASAGGQYGLVYAVVFAASQFGRAFAWSVTALALAADAVIVLSVLDPLAAASDWIVVACALPMITIVLQMTNAHGDRLRADLDALATTDALTGLSTRRALEAAAQTVLATDPSDDADPHAGLVLLDLDRFKEINDRHGHPVGDTILVRLAGILRAHAGPADVVARLGGDELAVLARGDAGTVARRAHAFHRAVRTELTAGSAGSPVTVSIGYAVAGPGAGLERLYEAADRALYDAKERGRDRVVAADAMPDRV